MVSDKHAGCEQEPPFLEWVRLSMSTIVRGKGHPLGTMASGAGTRQVKAATGRQALVGLA